MPVECPQFHCLKEAGRIILHSWSCIPSIGALKGKVNIRVEVTPFWGMSALFLLFLDVEASEGRCVGPSVVSNPNFLQMHSMGSRRHSLAPGLKTWVGSGLQGKCWPKPNSCCCLVSFIPVHYCLGVMASPKGNMHNEKWSRQGKFGKFPSWPFWKGVRKAV